MKAIVQSPSRSKSVTVEDLLNIPVPRTTATYTPVPHHTLVDTIVKESSNLGLNVLDTDYKVMRCGKQLFLSITFSGSSSDEYVWSLVGINSYDKTLAMRLGGGLYTKVCTNLSLSGDYHYYHKHTSGISIVDGVREALSGLNTCCNSLEDVMQTMKDTSITEDGGLALILKVAKDNVYLNKGNMYRVWDLWQNPVHEEFKIYTNSLYGLYQAFTTLCRDWDVNKKYSMLNSISKLMSL